MAIEKPDPPQALMKPSRSACLEDGFKIRIICSLSERTWRYRVSVHRVNGERRQIFLGNPLQGRRRRLEALIFSANTRVDEQKCKMHQAHTLVLILGKQVSDNFFPDLNVPILEILSYKTCRGSCKGVKKRRIAAAAAITVYFFLYKSSRVSLQVNLCFCLAINIHAINHFISKPNL